MHAAIERLCFHCKSPNVFSTSRGAWFCADCGKDFTASDIERKNGDKYLKARHNYLRNNVPDIGIIDLYREFYRLCDRDEKWEK